ncbi:MAG: branched-chain amino acid ABC transporter permease [Rhodoferax sp.]|jgi:branched-chain amino acid transport system permease protein|nr:branched-chain amino acid ABC transporter permease [Rhodoferax sp.]
MALALLSLLNGLSYGLLLFLLSAGLTVVFSLMGVLNFAHASFYMLGAYAGYALAEPLGFGPALVLAPLLVGLAGALFEHAVLRRVHPMGHVPELLVTFGLSIVLLELVQLVWGRAPVDFRAPQALRGAAFTLLEQADGGLTAVAGAAAAADCAAAARCHPFPANRLFMGATSLLALAGLWLMLARTRLGLVIRAAQTHPQMVRALGHDLGRVFLLVFGTGTALAALAGVIGGSTFVTEPSMAASVGTMVFVVVVVGGVGSLGGAFVASMLIGLLQTFAVGFDQPLLQGLPGVPPALARWSLAQLAPVLPYLVLVLMLVLRPQGLFGRPSP